MRAIVVRQRLVRTAAAAAASVALLAACGAKVDAGRASADPSGSTAATTYTAGMIAVSNGSDTVDFGGRKVKFPTTVTDAAWSPDGSRLAFIDHDGNIATAHPDGTSIVVLTKKADGVVRSRPAWSGASVLYTEKVGAKAPTTMYAYATPATESAETSVRRASTGINDENPDAEDGNESGANASRALVKARRSPSSARAPRDPRCGSLTCTSALRTSRNSWPAPNPC